jgi:hypothetical protein
MRPILRQEFLVPADPRGHIELAARVVILLMSKTCTVQALAALTNWHLRTWSMRCRSLQSSNTDRVAMGMLKLHAITRDVLLSFIRTLCSLMPFAESYILDDLNHAVLMVSDEATHSRKFSFSRNIKLWTSADLSSTTHYIVLPTRRKGAWLHGPFMSNKCCWWMNAHHSHSVHGTSFDLCCHWLRQT